MATRALTEKDVPIGTRFGYSVTISAPYLIQGAKQRHSHVDLRCEYEECGNLFVAAMNNLKYGHTTSCGCYLRKKMSRSQEGKTGSKSRSWKGEDGFTSKMSWLHQEKSNPCTDCGNRFNVVAMQFDHVPERGPKLFNVGQMKIKSKMTLEEVKAERAKCDLVCANCHAVRTAKRAVERRNSSHEVTTCSA